MGIRIAAALMVFSFCGCSQNDKEPDFRKTNWGITSEQVKILEEAKLVMDNGKMLSYDGTVGGYPCQIAYLFVQDQLTISHYFFKIDHTADSLYIHDFEKLKKAVSEKYGAPRLDDATWKDATSRNSNEKLGPAIRAGHVKLATQWETPATEVWLFLGGENSQIKLSMKYVSKLLANMKEDGAKDVRGDPEPSEF